jgi:hypothetical protein
VYWRFQFQESLKKPFPCISYRQDVRRALIKKCTLGIFLSTNRIIDRLRQIDADFKITKQQSADEKKVVEEEVRGTPYLIQFCINNQV